MKGLYCRLGADGAQPKFVIQETNVPSTLTSHEVKVQVKACALSPLDVKLLRELRLQREDDLVPVGREVVGVVLQVGSKVTFYQPDDEVVGILPLDTEMCGLCDVVLIHEHHIVQKPAGVGWVCAAAALSDGVRAYSALHTLGHMTAGHTLLVLDGASPAGVLSIQLAQAQGVKVLATAVSPDDQTLLEGLRPSVARVIGVWGDQSDVVQTCLEETGGLGVDLVLDSGVRQQEGSDSLLPDKHDIISLLGVGGHWVTSEPSLQLDPPDSRLLYLKAASLSFLNPEVWGASNARQGRYLHIMKDIMEKLSTGTLRPQVEEPVPLYEALVTMETVQKGRVRKRLVVQL